MSELDRLREITAKLQVLTDPQRPWVEYATEHGTCFGHALYYRPDLAVQIAYAEAQTTLPLHGHDEVEVIVVYQGSCDIYLGEGKDADCVHVAAGECYRIPPNTPHVFDTPEDCRLVAVTVPASPRYPHITVP